MRFKPPKFLRKIMPTLIWDIPDTGDCRHDCNDPSVAVTGRADERGHVFLTFDDGPTPGITEWILKELARFDMKATFFCLGKNVEMYPGLYERIIEEGHRVGNHTYNHPKGIGTTVRSYIRNVERANALLHSDMFRPPYGRISPKKARILSTRYKIVMWNVISRDYNRRLTRRACLNNVIKHARKGDMIVFHDSEKAFKNLLFALPRTLKWLQDNGLKSKSISI
jgi:peptidoglycan/xylan/chitin deacetylase (PgdA/CDA1 family)